MKSLTQLDCDRFFRAIEEYARVGKKDFVEALNRKSRDAFLMAAKAAPRAARTRIRGRYQGQYAYFSKAVAEANGYRVTPYTATSKETIILSNGTKKTRVRTRIRGHIFSNADRTAYWRTVVRRAISHIGFVRAFLKACADSINTACNFRAVKPSRLTNDSTFVCEVNPARYGEHSVYYMTASARYEYKRHSGTSSIIDRILADSLHHGLNAVEQDTWEYIEKKLSANAKAHSAA